MAVRLPDFYMVEQHFDVPVLEDPEAVARAETERLLPSIRRGQQVAVGVGSRGIAEIASMVRGVVSRLQKHGAEVFVFPAMGSHGGATSAGQRHVLETLGVTERTVGCEIRSSMQAIKLGVTESGFEVRFDANAAAAHHTVLVNRVKVHTDFVGRLGSGLVKMSVIGCGKRQGAELVHSQAKVHGYEAVLRAVGGYLLEKSNIVGGLAIVETPTHGPGRIEGLVADEIVEAEERLLELSKSWMARIPFDDIDLLIVDRIGKEISGVGMDPNVIGRNVIRGTEADFQHGTIRRIYARRLTEKSGGNGLGIGLADYVSGELLDAIDWDVTLANTLTAGNIELIRQP
ncbi:MAG: DUF362 domain-containing protein, partial [Planctomycetota bacterium]